MVTCWGIRNTPVALLAAACAQLSCGGVVKSGGAADAGRETPVEDSNGRPADADREASDGPGGSEVDTEAGPPDAGACGDLGQQCCGAGACTGTLPCIAGRCSCNTSADCPDHGTCRSDNRCLITLAADQFYPAALAVRGGEVYFANEATTALDFGSVVKVASAGGNPVTLASHQSTPSSLAVDDEYVYWGNLPGPHDGGSIVRVSTRGGAPTTLAAPGLGANDAVAGGVAISSTDVYWLTPTGIGSSAGQIVHVPKTGGSPSVLASGLGQPLALAIDGTTAYFTTRSSVGVVPLAGGAPKLFASGYYTLLSSLSVDSSRAYWVDTQPSTGEANGVVQAMPKGGGPVTTLATMQYGPSGVATNGTTAYFTVTSATAGAIVTVPVGGGTPATLVAGQDHAYAIAVDDSSVYWTTYSNFGAVRRLSPR